MISYEIIRENPTQFLACTGLTPDEFEVILPSFTQAWEEYRRRVYVNSGGGKPKLPKVTDKLFFILFYYKVYPIQEAMAVIFGISQSQVCTWIHTLSPILKQALGREKCLPERNPRKLKEVLAECDLQDFIIDGTERERQRPVDKQEQKDFYSGKKRHIHTTIS